MIKKCRGCQRYLEEWKLSPCSECQSYYCLYCQNEHLCELGPMIVSFGESDEDE